MKTLKLVALTLTSSLVMATASFAQSTIKQDVNKTGSHIKADAKSGNRHMKKGMHHAKNPAKHQVEKPS